MKMACCISWYSTYSGHENIENGLLVSTWGCYLGHGQAALYLSPSIEYSGHPRYAKVFKHEKMYIQMVLKVRVNKFLITEKNQGTLPGCMEPTEPCIDENFKIQNWNGL